MSVGLPVSSAGLSSSVWSKCRRRCSSPVVRRHRVSENFNLDKPGGAVTVIGGEELFRRQVAVEEVYICPADHCRCFGVSMSVRVSVVVVTTISDSQLARPRQQRPQNPQTPAWPRAMGARSMLAAAVQEQWSTSGSGGPACARAPVLKPRPAALRL